MVGQVKQVLKVTVNKYYIKAKFIFYGLGCQHYTTYNGYINKEMYNTILEKIRTVENHGCYFSTEHRISDNEKNIYIGIVGYSPGGFVNGGTIGEIHVIDELTSDDLSNVDTQDQYKKLLEIVGYCIGYEL